MTPFWDCLRDRINYFICFRGIDFVRLSRDFSAKKSSIGSTIMQ